MRRNGKAIILLAATVLMLVFGASAMAEYPDKPITMYAVFAPGGSLDSSARALCVAAEKVLGKPIVMVTKAGGGGTVGAAVLAGESPDGYTLAAATTSTLAVIPLRRKVPFRPLADFTYIFGYCAPSSGIQVRPDSPFKTFKDLVEYAKKNPGKIKYSSAGAGTPMHLAMAYVGQQEKINWIHVPYPGSADAGTACLGGHVDVVSSGELNLALTGQLVAIATHTETRLPQLPDVPTLMELGYDFFNETKFGIFGPAGMDPAVVKKLEDAFAVAVEDPRFRDVAEKFTLIPVSMRSKEFTKYINELWGVMTKRLQDAELIEEPATQPR
jgi:tripartite-type tricarboxylate transporter receptor subunit TctC